MAELDEDFPARLRERAQLNFTLVATARTRSLNYAILKRFLGQFKKIFLYPLEKDQQAQLADKYQISVKRLLEDELSQPEYSYREILDTINERYNSLKENPYVLRMICQTISDGVVRLFQRPNQREVELALEIYKLFKLKQYQIKLESIYNDNVLLFLNYRAQGQNWHE